jgi:thiamine-phosphate pyrophosphorylase
MVRRLGEKRCVTSSDTHETEAAQCRLYLITPSSIILDDFAPLLKDTLAAGDVACLQLRLKDIGEDDIRRAGERLLPIAADAGTALVINDRPDIAVQIDADGAHVGQDDMSALDARHILGPNRILGVTCHDSRHLAMVAAEHDADYVAFGAFFPTQTKDAKTRATPEILTWWADLFEIPSVAIGGITHENAANLMQAGADFLAVSGSVWNYAAGSAQAVADFDTLLSSIRRDTDTADSV